MMPLPQYCFEHRAAGALSDDSSIRIENHGVWSVIAGGRGELVGSSVHGLRVIMRPLNLGLIGLAIAVAIWGFAYKLSLYQPHPNQSAQTTVAKMWLGPEGTLLNARIPKSHLQPRGNLDAVLKPQVLSPLDARNGTWTASNVAVAVRKSFTDYPPRSPPAPVV